MDEHISVGTGVLMQPQDLSHPFQCTASNELHGLPYTLPRCDTQTHTHTHTYTYTYTHSLVHIPHTHTHTHTHVHTSRHLCTHAYTPAHTHKQTHTTHLLDLSKTMLLTFHALSACNLAVRVCLCSVYSCQHGPCYILSVLFPFSLCCGNQVHLSC